MPYVILMHLSPCFFRVLSYNQVEDPSYLEGKASFHRKVLLRWPVLGSDVFDFS